MFNNIEIYLDLQKSNYTFYMKQLLLVILLANCLAVFAQSTSYKPKTTTKKTTYTTVASKRFDSAMYFYNTGWDYYKKDSIGPARYYWEKASYSYYGRTKYKQAAMHRLGLIQQNGEGVDTNYVMALEYYIKASGTNNQLGDPDAIKNIGAYYENGIVYQKDNAKALEWYIKAKRAGNKFVDADIRRVRAKMVDYY